MGTKNLARTVIEGGRTGHSKNERRYSHREVRAALRDWLRAGGDGAPPRPKKAYRSFADKLSPTERWLASRCGRPWDEVFSELMAKFDPRTIAGRHVVFDHMLRDVGPWHDRELAWRDFVVDEDGILRVNTRRYRWRKKPRPVGRWVPAQELAAWAAGRKVGRRGRHWYWFVPVAAVAADAPPRFRQGGELSGQEARFWESLRDDARDGLRMKLSDAPSGT